LLSGSPAEALCMVQALGAKRLFPAPSAE